MASNATGETTSPYDKAWTIHASIIGLNMGNILFRGLELDQADPCLLYTSPSPRDATLSRMPSSA